MAGSSFSTERSDSPRLRRPTTSARESYEDTALPQVTSQELVLSHRRPLRGPESSVSTLQYAQESMAADPNVPRRTESTLRTVMRRIFTRKRRSQTDGLDGTPDSLTPKSQTSRSNKEGAEMSFLELRSQTPKSSSPLLHEHGGHRMLEVGSCMEPASSRRRRATLPSLILTDDGHLNTIEKALNPDSAGYSREGSAQANSDQTDSQCHGKLRANRRSRSACALRMMERDHRMFPIQWKRRSTDSTYVNSATFDTVSDDEMSSRPPTRTTVASGPTAPSEHEHPAQETESQDELDNMAPDIGNLVSCMQHSEDASLAQRLTTLEVKLIDLEFAIARMQSARAETSPIEAPKGVKPSLPTKSRRRARQDPPSQPIPESNSDGHTSPAHRPLSTATIRPSNLQRSRTVHTPSSPSLSLSDGSGISVEQYSALVTLLRHEQSARRHLEAQVASLRDDVQRLQRRAFKPILLDTMYPIRPKDSDLVRVRQALARCPVDSPDSDKVVSPYDTDSDAEPPGRDDVFGRPKWRYNRRIEVAGMI